MPRLKLNLLLVYQSVVFAGGLLLASGLVTRWGYWYSGYVQPRTQTDAFFLGRLAVGRNIGELRFDHTWSEGGEHQVWGLGMPLWRLPWEALARLCGLEAFPDRIAFGLYAGLVAFTALGAWVGTTLGAVQAPPPDRRGFDDQGKALRERHDAEPAGEPPAKERGLSVFMGAFVILLLFPPFLGLLQARGGVFEEAVAYEYLYAVMLVSLLIGLARQPTPGRWLPLSALAGIGALIRPTLIFYGFATVVVGGAVWVMAGWRRGRALSMKAPKPDGSWGGLELRRVFALTALGLALFCAGGGVLWLTNLLRFGDGFEFGHRLNVQTLYGSVYATKFDDPYQDEPLPSAARELFGALFQTRTLNGAGFYRRAFFPGQSSTVRWREFYFRTYDLSYVPLLLLGWGAGLWTIWRAASRRRTAGGQETSPPGAAAGRLPGGPWDAEVPVLAVWSILAAVPLLGFYLRSPVIASRYLLDLGPAFSVAVLAAWLFAASRCRRSWSRWVAVILLGAWVLVELSLASTSYGPPHSVTWAQARSLTTYRNPPADPIRPRSALSLESRPSLNAFDGAGWNSKTGALMPVVIVFAHNPEFLELELERQPNDAIPANPEDIRAKVQLEFLERESITPTDHGWRVRFKGPKQPRYQTGFQTVFIATVPKQHLADNSTPWVIQSVRWRAE